MCGSTSRMRTPQWESWPRRAKGGVAECATMSLVATLVLTLTAVQCAGGPLDCPKACKCRELSKENLPVLKAVCSTEPTGLWASRIGLLKMKTSMDQVKTTTLQDATNLKEVDLSSCNITIIMPGALGSLANLSILRLSHNSIEEINQDAFLKIPNLLHLYLDNNNIKIFNVQGTLNKLEKLFIQKNHLTEIPELSSSLQYLDASFNNITLFNTHTMVNLSYLDMCMNPLKEIISTTIPKRMKSLCISSNINAISENFNNDFSSLQNFSLISFPHVSTISKRIQDMLFPLHNIVTLYIANTKLNNLLFLPHMVKMEKLKLHQVSITDFSKADAALSSLNCIQILDLDRSPMLAGVLTKNFQILQKASCLETLSLKNSNIIHIPCELCKMKKRFRMDLRENPLECDCRIAEIQASLNTSLSNYIVSPKYTKCQSPQQVFDLTIDEYTQYANCSRSAVCAAENKTCRVPGSSELTADNNTSLQHEDNNTIYYIILGVITGILAIAIIALTIFYIILKKERRVEPQQEPRGQSFQQLQKTSSEDDTLLDG